MLARLVADGVQEVGLAEADAGVEVERIVERLAALVPGDAVGGGMGERVRAADDEALEGETRIERRAGELSRLAALLGRNRRARRWARPETEPWRPAPVAGAGSACVLGLRSSRTGVRARRR